MKRPVKSPAPKGKWIKPELKLLKAGSAESQRGPNPDGGGGFQGS
jgi:hypothetical protein